jgi:hypothetical protein
MGNREAFIADKNIVKIKKKHADDLRTGDIIKIYYIDDINIGEEVVKSKVLFTTKDAIAIRHPNSSNREIIIFDKSGNEIDPDEDETPMRIKWSKD